MSAEQAFLIGGGQIHRIIGERDTPTYPCVRRIVKITLERRP